MVLKITKKKEAGARTSKSTCLHSNIWKLLIVIDAYQIATKEYVTSSQCYHLIKFFTSGQGKNFNV